MASLWLPVGACMAAIFYASSLSTIPGPIEKISDVVLHATAYGLLAALAVRAIAKGRWDGITAAAIAGAWLIAVLYGVTDEWHQLYVPSRHAELRDLVNDAIGAAVALGAAKAWSMIGRRSQGSSRHDF